ncbi:hypothetical protein F5Y08DRAFT_351692 [Xylaria arbuscula]|nr:hypothetical protein F5Y08DRAFT_351692 [Xylaria arbuscula]
MALTILDLSMDVFQQILFHAILVRGLRRGLRLRLVCRAFSTSIRAPLLETGLLERFRLRFDYWQHSDRLWADQLFHDYIQIHILKSRGRPPAESYYSYWHKTAETYCQLTETQISVGEIIDKLCWMILKPNAYNFRHDLSALDEFCDTNDNKKPRPWRPDMNDSQSSLELLSIAAYLNDVRLAERLLSQYSILPWNSVRFNSPIYLAAYAGNTATFNLFKECAIKSGASKRLGPASPRHGHPRRQLDLAIADAFLGACESGSLEMLQLALSLPTIQGTDLGSNQQTEGSEREVQMLTKGHDIASSVEIYKYLDSLREKPEYSVLKHTLPECLTLEDVLKAQCRCGNSEIVRHILDQYPDMGKAKRTWSGKPNYMLARACRASYEDIVDIFLEKGREPNEPSTLREASRAGSLAIVRKLLDHGAVTDPWVIHAALMLEHESMVHMLLQNHPPIDTDWKYKILHNVRYRGLASMESLIRQSNQLMATPSELLEFRERDAQLDSTENTDFEKFVLHGVRSLFWKIQGIDIIRVRCAEPI